MWVFSIVFSLVVVTSFSKSKSNSTMLARDFYKIISSEDVAVSYLREHNLIDQVESVPPCHKCGSLMQEKKKRNRKGEFMPLLRCPKNGCQTYRSVREGNKFFHYSDLNGKINSRLSLCEILELMYYFVYETPINTTIKLTGKSPNTVTDWYNMCREVCSVMVSCQIRGKMVGTEENPIQIDEA